MQAFVPALFMVLLLTGFAVFPTHSSCQKNPVSVKPFQIISHSYGIKEGLPDVCISDVLLDSQGRLHLAACGNNYASSALQIYEFDGVAVYPSDFEIRSDAVALTFETAIAPDILYGYYKYKTENESIRYVVFQYHALTRTTERFEMPEQSIVQSVVFQTNALFACIYHPSVQQVEILQIQEGDITSLSRIPSDILKAPAIAKLAVTADEFWVARSAGLIHRINRKDGTYRPFSLPGLQRPGQPVRQIIASQGGDIWINCDGIYFWDASADHFTVNPYLPEGWEVDSIVQYLLSNDLLGNLLIGYVKRDRQISATLIDVNQQLFDYTPIFRAGADQDITGVNHFKSNDFRKGILFHFPGLRFVTFPPDNAIQHSKVSRHNRSLVQLDENKIYSLRYGTLAFERGEWVKTGEFLFKNDRGYFWDDDMKMDEQGNIWCSAVSPVNGKGCIERYRPDQKCIDTFMVDARAVRFDFPGTDQLVFATKEHLYWLDAKTGSSKRLTDKVFNGPVNQVVAGNDGIIWVGGARGLLKLDLRSGVQEWVDLGNEKVHVMRIHEDAKGRLWLGTIVKGVLIYDPDTGTVKTIDNTNGLSNNMVISFLEDDDGTIWAGTYSGVSLISPEGVVIGKISEADGLAENECNRWSALKMTDGRLCFGSNAGVSFIDPYLLKKRVKEGTPPVIYLTGLRSVRHGKLLTSINYLPGFIQNERTVLPVDNRNLQITFGLSNYIAPEKSAFAYRIDGLNNNWSYIGNQRQLSLNTLPAGKFRILVKGTDGWGRWSDPLVIPVTVEDYFYKRWWAFCLYGFFIASFLLLVRRYQIRRFKEEEKRLLLQEIDSLKTKLYTNITHEFRTPLTIITGMAEVIGNKPAQAKDLILRNGQVLLRLVNHMLDLSKLESGRLRLELMQADVVPFIQYLLESFQSFAASKHIQLIFNKTTDSVWMDFDEKSWK